MGVARSGGYTATLRFSNLVGSKAAVATLKRARLNWLVYEMAARLNFAFCMGNWYTAGLLHGARFWRRRMLTARNIFI